MTRLLFIETFALGAAAISAIYHLVLFIQQRDKFLLYYSAYLFTLTAYIVFKLISNNYDPFQPTDNVWYYIFEEVIQVSMVAVYVLFAAQTLEVVNEKSIVRTLMYLFFVLSALSICYHIYGAIINGAGVKSVQAYAVSRISLVSIATIALLFAWRIRTTIFQRIIIIGSLVYDCSGLLSIVSFTQHTGIFGLSGVEPYLVGCLLDIIIFSSALGYRLKTIAEEKNTLMKRENDAHMAIEKTRMSIAINLHDEVGSVLSSMSIYGEAAKKSLDSNNPERVLQLIDMIGENARETMGNMSDIVWSINPVNDNGLKLFNKMEAYANSQLSASSVDFNYEVDDNLYNEIFLMPVRQNVFFIFKEIINYCATQAKSVSVKFGKCGEQFIMEVTNDGKCFSNPSPMEKCWSDVLAGNGFKDLKKRADELEGKIKVELTDTGTKITLQFLINQHYTV